jgi:hypothetical protein
MPARNTVARVPTSDVRIRKLVATIANAASELLVVLESSGDGGSEYDQVDRARRRRPEWQRRGRVFYAMEQRGGGVEFIDFISIVLAAGYADMRGANGFFRGDPVPVLERHGDSVALTDRGRDAARFYREYWLPREEESVIDRLRRCGSLRSAR